MKKKVTVRKTAQKVDYILSVTDAARAAAAIRAGSGTDLEAMIALGDMAALCDERGWIKGAKKQTVPGFIESLADLLPKIMAANDEQFKAMQSAGAKLAELMAKAKA